MPGRDIVVVGGSAGGVEAAISFCRHLPAELPAAVFIVIHLAGDRESVLAELLNDSSLPVSVAEDGAEIHLEHVYVAPPDFHLLVSRDHMRVVPGPRYNRVRPAIDPLFHSATRVFGPRVVGVVLSGTLDDGVAGLAAIHRRGGIAIVQDPATAQFTEMPMTALSQVRVDYRLPPEDMGAVLEQLARAPIDDTMPPAEKRLDAEFSNLVGTKIDMSDIGKPSVFACPDCNGVLWEVDEGGILHFHCRIGHGYSGASLLADQDKAVEDSLWAALRALEENIHMRRKLADKMGHFAGLNAGIRGRLEESERHAQRLRELLYERGGGNRGEEILNAPTG